MYYDGGVGFDSPDAGIPLFIDTGSPSYSNGRAVGVGPAEARRSPAPIDSYTTNHASPSSVTPPLRHDRQRDAEERYLHLTDEELQDIQRLPLTKEENLLYAELRAMATEPADTAAPDTTQISHLRRIRKDIKDLMASPHARLLDAYALYLLYKVTQGATYHSDVEHERQLRILEKEWHSNASQFQTPPPASNETLMSTASTMLLGLLSITHRAVKKGGPIESDLRAGGEEAGRETHVRYSNYRELIGRSIPQEWQSPTASRPIYERMASIDWDLQYLAKLRRDLPYSGIQGADFVQRRYPASYVVGSRLRTLQTDYPYLFDGRGITGYVDVRRLSEGRDAADCTQSAYERSGGMFRETILPMLASSIAVLIANARGGSKLWFSLVATLAVQGANYLYNTYSVADEARVQSGRAGISQVSGDEARRNRNVFWTGFALTALSSVCFGRLGAGLIQGGSKALRWGASAAGREAIGRVLSRKAIGEFINRIPIGSKVRLGLSLLYPADYFFLGEEKKVDTVWGYVGAAAFWSEVSYRLFSLTWREGTVTNSILGFEKTFTGFAEQIKNSLLRGALIHIGADLVMADYFLFDKNYHLIDFGMSRETEEGYHEFEDQFAVDNWLGYAGLGLMFGDWARTEFLSFPMYFNTAQQVSWAQARVLISGGMVAADYLPDRKLDKWYLGGIGGSILMTEAASIMLQVDAWGSVVALGFKIGTEWLMQYQQGVELATPDPSRLMWASLESALMRFPSKGIVLGHRFFGVPGTQRGSPVGRRMVGALDRVRERSPEVARQARSIEHMREPPELVGRRLGPGWRLKRVPLRRVETIPLLREAEGTLVRAGSNVQMKVSRGGLGRRVKITIIRSKGREVIRTTIDTKGKPHKKIEQLLRANGYIRGENGRVYRVQALYRGELRLRGRRMTADDVGAMRQDDPRRAAVMLELEDRGFRVAYDKGSSRHYFEQHRIRNPEAPRIELRRVDEPDTYSNDWDRTKVVNLDFSRTTGQTPGTQTGLIFDRQWVPLQPNANIVVTSAADRFTVARFMRPLTNIRSARRLGGWLGRTRPIRMIRGIGRSVADTAGAMRQRAQGFIDARPRFRSVVDRVARVTRPVTDRVLHPVDRVINPVLGSFETLTVFKGPLMEPQLRWGILPNAALSWGISYAMTSLIFRKPMSGDAQYQPLQNSANYLFANLFTHPLFQWPLGYDTPPAQGVGRTIGVAENLIVNRFFPTYRDSWPGNKTYYARLEGDRYSIMSRVQGWLHDKVDFVSSPARVPEKALDTWMTAMTSWQIVDWEAVPELLRPSFEQAEGSNYAYEPPALNSFRAIEDLYLTSAAALPPARESYAGIPAKLKQQVTEDIATLTETGRLAGTLKTRYERLTRELGEGIPQWDKLGTRERRGIIIMVAHLKFIRKKITSRETQDSTLREIAMIIGKFERDYVTLCSSVPDADTKENWNDWIRRVNKGEGDRIRVN